MLPREHVQAAFAFEPVRPVPYWMQWDAGLDGPLDEYFGGRAWRGRLVPYMYGRHVGHVLTPTADGRQQDAFGTIVRAGNITHVEEPVLAEGTLEGYTWPEPETLVDWDALRAEYAARRDSFRLCGLAMGLFERAWFMRGFDSLLMDMIFEGDFIEQLLDGILATHLAVMDRIIDRIEIEAYFGGDDWCDQRTILMGPDLWRQHFKPRLSKMIDHCHARGKPYVLHSCGNVSPLIDDLMEIGLDALESLQSEAMNVYKVKRKAVGRLVLIGGLGVQRIVPFGSEDEVRHETRRLIDELGAGGGYVLAPSKPIPAGTPVRNAAAAIETAMHQGG